MVPGCCRNLLYPNSCSPHRAVCGEAIASGSLPAFLCCILQVMLRSFLTTDIGVAQLMGGGRPPMSTRSRCILYCGKAAGRCHLIEACLDRRQCHCSLATAGAPSSRLDDKDVPKVSQPAALLCPCMHGNLRMASDLFQSVDRCRSCKRQRP